MRLSVAVVLAIATIVGACGSPAPSPPPTTESPVEGAWRVTEVTVTGANPSTTADPAGVFIFGKTHYSMMRVIGGAQRASFEGVNPTNEEKVAAYDTFVANTGTYELAGSTLTVRPIVSKHPNFMGGGFDTYEVRSEGETLWLTGKSTNIRFMIGGTLVPDPDPTDETRFKLVRIQ